MKSALTATLLLLGAAFAPVPAQSSPDKPIAPIAPIAPAAQSAARGDSAAQAAPRAGFEHALPATSFAFLGIADVDALKHDVEACSWGRLWADPACDSMRAGFRQQWESVTALVKQLVGVDALHLLDLVHGRFTIAVTGLPDLQADAEEDTFRGVGVVLLADFGADADEARQLLEQLMDRAGELPDTARSVENSGGTEVTVLHGKTRTEPDSLAVRIAFHDDTLVLQAGVLEPKVDSFGALLEALDGHAGAEVLADAPGFRSSVASQPGGVQCWMDLAQAVDLGLAASRREASQSAEAGGEAGEAPSPIDGVTMPEFLKRLGVMNLGPLAVNSTWDAHGMRMRLHVALPGEGWVQGALRLLAAPGATGHPASVAADVKSMTALHVDFAGLFDQVLRVLIEAKVVPPDEVASALASMEESLGFDLKEDLLAQLDGQITVVMDQVEVGEALPGSEANPMNVAVLMGLTDGKRFNAVIEDLIRSRGLHAGRKLTEFQGHEIYTLTVPPFSVHYCVLPDALVVSMSPTMLQDVLRHRASADLPSLAQSADYKAMLGTVGSRPGMVSYGLAGKGLTNAFHVMTAAVSTGVRAGLRGRSTPELDAFLDFVEGLQFPEQAVVDKYIHGGSVSTVTADESGLSMESFQP